MTTAELSRVAAHLAMQFRNDDDIQTRLRAATDTSSVWRQLIAEREDIAARAHGILNLPTVHVPPSNGQLPEKTVQPGDVLAFVIKTVTGESPNNCQCGARQSLMNQWGWWGCWKDRTTIIEWLCEEAATRGHMIDRANALALFKAALKELRRSK